MVESILDVKGKIIKNFSLSKFLWFKTGGNSNVFIPEDEEDISKFLNALNKDIDVFAIGCGSNTLVRDGGFKGFIIRTSLLNKITVDDKNPCRIKCMGGSLDLSVAKKAQTNGIGGMEFLSGIPGTIGAAVFMNAGAYGREMKDIFVSAKGVNRSGEILNFSKNDITFFYRGSDLDPNVIITEVVVEGKEKDKNIIKREMDEILISRKDSQPTRSRTGGSTFKNPKGHKAWELIDKVDMRGKKIGGAMISDKHANFLINYNNATSKDLEMLGNSVVKEIKNKFDIDLEWEVKIIGDE